VSGKKRWKAVTDSQDKGRRGGESSAVANSVLEDDRGQVWVVPQKKTNQGRRSANRKGQAVVQKRMSWARTNRRPGEGTGETGGGKLSGAERETTGDKESDAAKGGDQYDRIRQRGTRSLEREGALNAVTGGNERENRKNGLVRSSPCDDGTAGDFLWPANRREHQLGVLCKQKLGA